VAAEAVVAVPSSSARTRIVRAPYLVSILFMGVTSSPNEEEILHRI